MKQLFLFECKKILRRKSTWIALLGVLAFMLFLTGMRAAQISRIDRDGKELSGLAAIALTREQAAVWEGPLTADKLAEALAIYQNAQLDPDNLISGESGETYLSDAAYAVYAQPNAELHNLIRRTFSPVGNYNYFILDDLSRKDMEQFYAVRMQKTEEVLNREYTDGNLSEAERSFFRELNAKVQQPYHFAYIEGWEHIVELFSTAVLAIAFVLCVCLSPLFALEYQTGADSVILSSRYGKSRIITAKLLASLCFTTVVYWIGTLLFAGFFLLAFGTDGWNASLQILSLTAPFSLTMWEACLLGGLLGYLVILSVMAAIVLLSALLRTPFAAIITSALWLFVPLFLPSSKIHGVYNHILALLPGKAADTITAFGIYSAYDFWGNVVSLPTMIAVVSLLFVAMVPPFVYRGFRKHQVV